MVDRVWVEYPKVVRNIYLLDICVPQDNNIIIPQHHIRIVRIIIEMQEIGCDLFRDGVRDGNIQMHRRLIMILLVIYPRHRMRVNIIIITIPIIITGGIVLIMIPQTCIIEDLIIQGFGRDLIEIPEQRAQG